MRIFFVSLLLITLSVWGEYNPDTRYRYPLVADPLHDQNCTGKQPLIDGIRIGLVILVFPEYSIQISLVYEKGRTCLVVLDVVDIKTIDIITHWIAMGHQKEPYTALPAPLTLPEVFLPSAYNQHIVIGVFHNRIWIIQHGKHYECMHTKKSSDKGVVYALLPHRRGIP